MKKQNENENIKSTSDETIDENQFKIVEIEKPPYESEHHHHHSSDDSEHHHHHSSCDSKHRHHHSSSGHHHHHHKKKHTGRNIFISILCVFLVLVIAITGTFLFLKSEGNKSLTTSVSSVDIDNTLEYNGHTYQYNENMISIAFFGIDKENLGLEDGTIGTAGQNDTNMILAFDKSTGATKLICIPRETMAEVDVYSKSGNFVNTEKMQLCLSYAYGDGKKTSCQNALTTLSRILYEIPIEKYFALDLDGIGAINDSVGGVTVESLYNFKNEGVSIGDSVHIEGSFAETYVRYRDIDSINASLNRLERQKQYIRAFVAETASATKSDFTTISKLYKTASQYSYTNLSLSDVTYLGATALSKGTSTFETISIDGKMKEKQTGNPDAVNAAFYPDEDELYKTVIDIYYTEID